MMTEIMAENNCKRNDEDELKLVFDRRKPPLSRQRSLPATRSNNNNNNNNKDDNHSGCHRQKSLSSREELKLAAVAISLNVNLRSADMPISMMERAFRYARSFLDAAASAASSSTSSVSRHRPSPTLLARSIKKEFDSFYGPAWHCVVGKSFGSFVSHSPGGFVYFSVESFSFLLFKTEVHLVNEH